MTEEFDRLVACCASAVMAGSRPLRWEIRESLYVRLAASEEEFYLQPVDPDGRPPTLLGLPYEIGQPSADLGFELIVRQAVAEPLTSPAP